MKNIFFIISVIFITSCNNSIEEPTPQVYSGKALGTSFQLQYFYSEELELTQAIDSTFTVLNQSLSTYIPNSDISRINQGDSSIVVDQQFIDNFKASKSIYDITDGYFDPTVGLLVNAYGFGPEKYQLKMNSNTIDSLMNFVGFNKVQLRENGKIVKQTSGVYLDFNSIAKGYAVDRLAELLEQYQVENYLIEVGGELVGKGKNLQTNEGWKIGIDKPNPKKDKSRDLLEFIVNLDDRAMATSGNYRKFKTDSLGNKYVHTINPKTGLSEATDMLSATVFAKNCMMADAYATAFMAMGYEKSMQTISKLNDLSVIFIYAEEQEVKTFISEEIKPYLEQL